MPDLIIEVLMNDQPHISIVINMLNASIQYESYHPPWRRMGAPFVGHVMLVVPCGKQMYNSD